MTDKSEHKNIHEALHACYGKLGYVQKAGRNTQQNYNFAGEADFIAALRPELIAHGIVFYCSGIRDVETRALPRGDKHTYTTTGTYDWTFAHAPSGTSIVVSSRGEGNDTSDKASYKAATGALKYALRQTLLIETGDDPDQDQRGHHHESDEPKMPDRGWYDKTLAAIDAAGDMDDLKQVWTMASPFVSIMKKGDADYIKLGKTLEGAKNARKKFLDAMAKDMADEHEMQQARMQ